MVLFLPLEFNIDNGELSDRSLSPVPGSQANQSTAVVTSGNAEEEEVKEYRRARRLFLTFLIAGNILGLFGMIALLIIIFKYTRGRSLWWSKAAYEIHVFTMALFMLCVHGNG